MKGGKISQQDSFFLSEYKKKTTSPERGKFYSHSRVLLHVTTLTNYKEVRLHA